MPVVMKLYMINQSSGASALFRPHQEMKKLMLCWSFVSPGFSSGSAGVNTRLSTGGTLQLNQQDAKPTHLSMKPWQLPKTMRVWKVRANLALNFLFLAKSLPFLSATVEIFHLLL